jgi:hypothetical protein
MHARNVWQCMAVYGPKPYTLNAHLTRSALGIACARNMRPRHTHQEAGVRGTHETREVTIFRQVSTNLRERAQVKAACFAQGSTTHARQDHKASQRRDGSNSKRSCRNVARVRATVHMCMGAWLHGCIGAWVHGDGRCTFTTISVERNSVADEQGRRQQHR